METGKRNTQDRTTETAIVRLAHRVGIETQYISATGKRIVIAPPIIRSLLSAMGYEVSDELDAERLLKEIAASSKARRLPPVVVVREDQSPFHIPVNLPAAEANTPWRLVLEDGTVAAEGVVSGANGRDGATAFNVGQARVTLNQKLPCGYHCLKVGSATMPLIVAPVRCWMPPEMEIGERIWGLAVQLYLLRSRLNWGIGDFGDLATIVDVAASSGASVIGLNPLHAMFLDNPEHASPYSPASRLFLNVLNIDVPSIPEFNDCPDAQSVVKSHEFSQTLNRVRNAELVDYSSVTNLKLNVLRVIFEHFVREAAQERILAFHNFVSEQSSALEPFCLFQAIRLSFAVKDSTAADWHKWPDEFRRPDSNAVEHFADEHAREIEFLSWLQWIADLQLSEAAGLARSRSMLIGLYRDLAVGADAAGAESWFQQEVMVEKANVGAPPDIFNPAGQDWSIPPLHPEKLRERGYQEYIQLIRANMRHAGALRIDHVLGLQHLYWIPKGRSPSEGAYVTYPFDDLSAILALESWRNKCLVIGEDLGTVPAGFRQRISERGIFSYRVLYFEKRKDSEDFCLPDEYPRLSLASIGSHDLATLRGWWQLDDIQLRIQHDLYPDPKIAKQQQEERAEEKLHLLSILRKIGLSPGDGANYASLCFAVHAFLARSNAGIAMLQLENLTCEKSQINLPGTTDQYPNWRHRISIPLEQIWTDTSIKKIFDLFRNERPLSRHQQHPTTISLRGSQKHPLTHFDE